QQALLHPQLFAPRPPVFTQPVTLAPITLTTPTGSLMLPAQPFTFTLASPATATHPAVFVLATAGGSLPVTGPFLFTSPLFNFSVGMTGVTPALAAAMARHA